MASIKQNLAGQPLPDFRNSGVMLRILLGVNLLALGAALVQSQGVQDSVQHFIDMAAWVQPLLLFNLALLAILANILKVTGLEAPPLNITREMLSIVGDAVLSEDKAVEAA